MAIRVNCSLKLPITSSMPMIGGEQVDVSRGLRRFEQLTEDCAFSWAAITEYLHRLIGGLMYGQAGAAKVVIRAALLMGLLMASSLAVFAGGKNETIDATAWGRHPSRAEYRRDVEYLSVFDTSGPDRFWCRRTKRARIKPS